MLRHEEKDIILFVGKMEMAPVEDVARFSKEYGKKYVPALITSLGAKVEEALEQRLAFLVRCDTRDMKVVEKRLRPYEDRIAAIISRYEFSMPLYGRLADLFPYLRLPTARSLAVASNKINMRRAFRRYDKKITPRFVVVKRSGQTAVKKIIEKIGFPCVIKPANLAKSQLVMVCYYKEELKNNLKVTMQKVRKLYHKAKVEWEPTLLVEEFMEGQMYSIDAYVNSRGYLEYTPIIEIKTGRDAGYDDFFMYTQIVPSILNAKEEERARVVVAKATHAIGLRSSTVHAELMRTQRGWKVIEVGARVGGFRDRLLNTAYGFHHTGNDFRIHLGKKPIIKRKPLKHVGFIKFFPQKPGRLASLVGVKLVEKLRSVIKVTQNKKVGDFCGLSRFGHPYVLGVTIAAPSRSKLLGDLRKVEKMVQIKTA
ncbi:MAG: ATP-grasp domain-containing protein [Patescibacteria group bacterium]